ncbi:unnamed protein product [Penicillium roqueforti FM164]|uniref:Uncharacterized protein n=1 Tax=Penicillium roqueforti (strain FM164) TaxID=1365484 RepID=W6QRA1_PENRF|nr:unnamed protein product [Penicillium roqueforti FM164]
MAYNFTILTSQSQPVQYRLLWQGLSKKTDKQHNYDLGIEPLPTGHEKSQKHYAPAQLRWLSSPSDGFKPNLYVMPSMF